MNARFSLLLLLLGLTAGQAGPAPRPVQTVGWWAEPAQSPTHTPAVEPTPARATIHVLFDELSPLGYHSPDIRVITLRVQLDAVEALQAAEYPMASTRFGALGEAVCSIDGVGCPASACFCKYPKYWAFYQWKSGRWMPATRGPSQVVVEPGAHLAWVWGRPELPTPRPEPSPTPEVTASPSPSLTPSPQWTASPAFTPATASPTDTGGWTRRGFLPAVMRRAGALPSG
jgi:hypothetical protein